MNRLSFAKSFVSVMLTAVIAGGCSSDATTTEPEEVGRVIVSIKDDTNAPISGILVELFVTSNKNTPWAATTTGADGTGEFSPSFGGVKLQSYVVRVISLTNYSLAAGETNDKPVTPVANQTQTVTFTLTKKVAPPA